MGYHIGQSCWVLLQLFWCCFVYLFLDTKTRKNWASATINRRSRLNSTQIGPPTNDRTSDETTCGLLDIKEYQRIPELRLHNSGILCNGHKPKCQPIKNIPEPGEPTNQSPNMVHRIGDQPLHVTHVPKTRKLTPEDAQMKPQMAVQASLRMDTALMTTEDGSSRRYSRKFVINRGANGVWPGYPVKL